MKKWLRGFLGVNEIMVELATVREELYTVKRWTNSIYNTVGDTKHNINVTNRAIGRIIAKIDPIIAGDELDPVRKAESDKLSASIIAKMLGEVKASNPT